MSMDYIGAFHMSCFSKKGAESHAVPVAVVPASPSLLPGAAWVPLLHGSSLVSSVLFTFLLPLLHGSFRSYTSRNSTITSITKKQPDTLEKLMEVNGLARCDLPSLQSRVEYKQ